MSKASPASSLGMGGDASLEVGQPRMRIILSRKGFDSANGGGPSPIFPDGEMVSLPIPSRLAPVSYSRVKAKRMSLGDLVPALTNGRVGAGDGAHVDPDLYPEFLRRVPGWRPAFGQVDAAQTHLADQGVGQGDLFLFFGWFREVHLAGGTWKLRRNAPDLHVLFGWLQVGDVVPLGAGPGEALRKYPWLSEHPHIHSSGPNNTVYVAAERLDLTPSATPSCPGAGAFRRFSESLVLTRPGQPLRSLWRLPRWMAPQAGAKPLSYHADPDRWSMKSTHVELRSVGRGQEFVLDCDKSPEAVPWVTSLLSSNASINS